MSGPTVAEAFVTIRPDVSGFTRALEPAMRQSMLDVGKIAGGVLGAQIAAQASAHLKNFLTGTINAASDLEESLNAVDQVFATSAITIRQWGEESANAFGLSQRAFNELATPMGAILRNLGFTQDETARKTIALTERAADMASVFNTDVSDALAAINSALRGEANPIERYGVSVNQTAVNLRALADTGKTSAEALTEHEKAVARLALVFEQTEAVAGDFANTSDGLANSQRILAAEVEELQAKIGVGLLPVVTEVVGAAREMVEIIDANIEAMGRLADAADDAGIDVRTLGAAFLSSVQATVNQYRAYLMLLPTLADLVAGEKGATNAMVENEAAIRAQVAGIWEASRATEQATVSVNSFRAELRELGVDAIASMLSVQVGLGSTLEEMEENRNAAVRALREALIVQKADRDIIEALFRDADPTGRLRGITQAATGTTGSLRRATEEAGELESTLDAAAEAAGRMFEEARQQMVRDLDTLGRGLVTALQREQDAALDATLRGIERERDARMDAHNERIGAIGRERDTALAAIDAELAALTRAANDDRLADLQRQLAIAWDPRERARIEQQITEHMRREEAERLRAQRRTVEDEAHARERAAEAELQAAMRTLDRQAQDAREAYERMTDAWTLESRARELLMAGELDTITGLIEEHVPEWSSLWQSWGESVLNGPLADIRRELTGILALQAQFAGTGAPSTPTAALSGVVASMNALGAQMVAAGAPAALIEAHRQAVRGRGGLPAFDRGGIVPGPIGAPTLAVVHGGETVLPTHREPMPAPVVNIDMRGSQFLGEPEANAEAIRRVLHQELGVAARFERGFR